MIDNISSFFKKFAGLSGTSTITVNGKSFQGNSVSIVNGEIIVDGKKVSSPTEKEINITITGDIKELILDSGTIKMEGDVGNLEVNHGKVGIQGDVKGNASIKHGNLECDNIFADVDVAHGNVRAATIHGAVAVKMGNISR